MRGIILNTSLMIEEKKCIRCEKLKHSSLFHKKSASSDGLHSYCKDCIREYNKENAEWAAIRKRRYYLNNRKKINDYCVKYARERQSYDPLYKFNKSIRKLIARAIKNTGSKKKSKTSDILGLTPKKFRLYLEGKFKGGMSWQNYGEWHIDHIIPMSSAKDEFEAEILNHHLNLQPMWAEDNLKKSDSYNEEDKKNMIRVILNARLI